MFRTRPSLLLTCMIAVMVAGNAAAGSDKTTVGLVLEGTRDNQTSTQVMNAVTSALIETRRFQVVERKELKTIFEEKSLQDVLGDPETASILNTLGAELIGFVSYTASRSSTQAEFNIVVRLTRVVDAAVIGTYDSSRPSLVAAPSPQDAGRRLALNLRDAFPPIGIVVQVFDPKTVLIDLGSGVGIKKGDLIEVQSVGAPIRHPDGYMLSGPVHSVGTLKVTTVQIDSATCKVKNAKVDLAAGMRVTYQSKLNKFIPKPLQRWWGKG